MHVEHILAVLQRLNEEKRYAKLKKCTFAQPKIEFCGFMVNSDDIATHPEKMRIIAAWLTLQNVN